MNSKMKIMVFVSFLGFFHSVFSSDWIAKERNRFEKDRMAYSAKLLEQLVNSEDSNLKNYLPVTPGEHFSINGESLRFLGAFGEYLIFKSNKKNEKFLVFKKSSSDLKNIKIGRHTSVDKDYFINFPFTPAPSFEKREDMLIAIKEAIKQSKQNPNESASFPSPKKEFKIKTIELTPNFIFSWGKNVQWRRAWGDCGDNYLTKRGHDKIKTKRELKWVIGATSFKSLKKEKKYSRRNELSENLESIWKSYELNKFSKDVKIDEFIIYNSKVYVLISRESLRKKKMITVERFIEFFDVLETEKEKIEVKEENDEDNNREDFTFEDDLLLSRDDSSSPCQSLIYGDSILSSSKEVEVIEDFTDMYRKNKAKKYEYKIKKYESELMKYKYKIMKLEMAN